MPDGVPMSRCEMVHVSPGEHGQGVEIPCRRDAEGTHEKTVRVCRPCGEGLEAEEFVIAWDPEPTFCCTRCKRDVTWDQGADDGHPEWCDDCWAARHRWPCLTCWLRDLAEWWRLRKRDRNAD